MYAVLISMFFYNALIYLIILERSYLYYVLYLGSLTLFISCMHGWAYKLFWPSDATASYGGEEFTVLLPNTPKLGAYLIAGRIRQNIEKLEIEWEGKLISVTMSLGFMGCIPVSQKAEAALLKQAVDFYIMLNDMVVIRLFMKITFI